MTSFRAYFALMALICMGGLSGALASESLFFDTPHSRVCVANAQTYGYKESQGISWAL